MADGIDEGVAYPLTSKMIKLNYLIKAFGWRAWVINSCSTE